MTQHELEQLVDACKKECELAGIQLGRVLKVVVNSRAKSRWGQCKPLSIGYEIQISNELMQDGVPLKSVKKVIVHELCHTIKGSRGHDKIWKDATKKMNDMFGYDISRTDSAEQLGVKLKHEKYKHIFKCTNCGLVYYRAKNIYELKRCRCGKCNARALIRIK